MGLCPDVWEGDKAEARPFFTANLPNFPSCRRPFRPPRLTAASVNAHLCWVYKQRTSQDTAAEGAGQGGSIWPLFSGRGVDSVTQLNQAQDVRASGPPPRCPR